MDSSERRRRVLDAAETLFVERGFSRTNMDLVAKACGMSKQTVYGLFPSKEALFVALVEESVPPPPDFDPSTTRGLEEELIELMEDVAGRALSPRQIAMTRLVIEETREAPELRRDFHERGVARGRAFLAERIERLAAKHGVDFGRDSLQVSDTLFGAVIGGAMVHALIGDVDPAAGEPTGERVRGIVHLLARSVQADKTAQP